MVTSAAPVPVAQQHIVALLVLLLAAHTARHAFSGDIVVVVVCSRSSPVCQR